MNLIESIANNKTIANIAFKQIKKHIKENKIQLIAIYLDPTTGDIEAKQYDEPVVIIKLSDYQKLLENGK